MDILFWILYFIVAIGGIIYYGLQVLFLIAFVLFLFYGVGYVLYERLTKPR